ncbi:hypothetical protein POSPLADRAFT_1048699 [Postia placenta MAD-698-R-SB12]|uniref:Cell division control protein 14 n=1 Tax=Postia placenta MAD-698-R-SB12 TaxID=670580 RepID=A0A1X6MSI6_9APHY|nr:hypothetical protein POSPLADRAFT_1048699 [Postia placenta MAD-698-R-SB12]OSX59361.1 hypothetical protein POSPLADRAFT_1048699 [Postia placenta MAD-698-R-SB12]
MSTMKGVLLDALDELVSARTSTTRIGEILTTLERLLAEVCTPNADPAAAERLQIFIRLQDTFECNVPSRLLSWMSLVTTRLEYITSNPRLPKIARQNGPHVRRSFVQDERKSEIITLSTQLLQTLSIIQGVVLTHKGSKRYLGRRYALESGENGSRSSSENVSTISLASIVLDTLLCVLVDSSPALRVFEDLKGVQLVVRILKRAGTPREVRMKCLEFLYFYLLDETTSLSSGTSAHEQDASAGPDAHIPSSGDIRPSHQSIPSTSSTSSRGSSGSSYSSIFSSASAVSTSATSVSSTSRLSGESSEPEKPVSRSPPAASETLAPALAPSPRIVTPPNQRAKPRSLLMLQKEVDYVPLSPKKAQVSRLGVGTPRAGSALRPKLKSRGPVDVLDASSLLSSPEAEKTPLAATAATRAISAAACLQTPEGKPYSGARTMEEKKEILGSMLGNVEALVEGVRKAGIWGLG